MLTHIKLAAAFPTDHRAARGAARATGSRAKRRSSIAGADVILSLDWLDLGGALKQAFGAEPSRRSHPRLVRRALAPRLEHGPSRAAAGRRLSHVRARRGGAAAARCGAAARERAPEAAGASAACARSRAHDRAASRYALEAATRGIDVCITRLPLGWHGGYTHFRHPLDYIGHDGGGGVGAGPGITVGAGLALKGSGPHADRAHGRRRLPHGQHRDLDRGALRHPVPHDRVQQPLVLQRRAATRSASPIARGRPPENRWIGQRISDPDIDIAAMARAQGATAIGPVTSVDAMHAAVKQAVETVRGGGVCVIDARVMPGYDGE